MINGRVIREGIRTNRLRMLLQEEARIAQYVGQLEQVLSQERHKLKVIQESLRLDPPCEDCIGNGAALSGEECPNCKGTGLKIPEHPEVTDGYR